MRCQGHPALLPTTSSFGGFSKRRFCDRNWAETRIAVFGSERLVSYLEACWKLRISSSWCARSCLSSRFSVGVSRAIRCVKKLRTMTPPLVSRIVSQFYTLNARFAPQRLVSSALTIASCIGFSITIVSIALLSWLIETAGPQYAFLILVPGPVLGLAALRRLAARPV